MIFGKRMSHMFTQFQCPCVHRDQFRTDFVFAHSEEKVKDVKSHCLQASAFMNVPRQIKTDNGPAYTKHFNNSVLISIFFIKQVSLTILKAKQL